MKLFMLAAAMICAVAAPIAAAQTVTLPIVQNAAGQKVGSGAAVLIDSSGAAIGGANPLPIASRPVTYTDQTIASLSAGQAAGTAQVIAANPNRRVFAITPTNDGRLYITTAAGNGFYWPLYAGVTRVLSGADCPTNALYVTGQTPALRFRWRRADPMGESGAGDRAYQLMLQTGMLGSRQFGDRGPTYDNTGPINDWLKAVRNGVGRRGGLLAPWTSKVQDVIVTGDMSGVTLQGVPGLSKISHNVTYQVLKLGNVIDCSFLDFALETLFDSGDPNIVQEDLSGVLFQDSLAQKRCVFRLFITAPNANTNGVKFVVEGDDPAERNWWEFIIERVGRQGLEVQNHGKTGASKPDRDADTVSRVLQSWVRGKAKSTGLKTATQAGQGFSFSGYMLTLDVNVDVEDNQGIGAFEVVGPSYSKFIIRNQKQTRLIGGGLTMTTTTPYRPMTNNELQWTDLDVCPIGHKIYSQAKLREIGSSYKTTGPVYYRDCPDGLSRSCEYYSSDKTAVVIETSATAPSTYYAQRRVWDRCTADVTAAPGGVIAPVRFQGANTTGNIWDEPHLHKGPSNVSGGSYADQINGAIGNQMYNVSRDEGGGPFDRTYIEKDISAGDVDMSKDPIIYNTIRLFGVKTGVRNIILPPGWRKNGGEIIINDSTGGQDTTIKPSTGTGENIAEGARKRAVPVGTNIKLV